MDNKNVYVIKMLFDWKISLQAANCELQTGQGGSNMAAVAARVMMMMMMMTKNVKVQLCSRPF